MCLERGTLVVLLCLLMKVAVTSGFDLTAVDEYVIGRMRASHIPGLALAIVIGDRIADVKGCRSQPIHDVVIHL